MSEIVWKSKKLSKIKKNSWILFDFSINSFFGWFLVTWSSAFCASIPIIFPNQKQILIYCHIFCFFKISQHFWSSKICLHFFWNWSSMCKLKRTQTFAWKMFHFLHQSCGRWWEICIINAAKKVNSALSLNLSIPR